MPTPSIFGCAKQHVVRHIPFFLVQLPELMIVIVCRNKFSGEIKHLKHKIGFPSLDVLDIASTQFLGKLSTDFFIVTQLRSLKISENKLEGNLPASLDKCKRLEVLNFGNNLIHDKFSFRLEKLPSLKVLILRGNIFLCNITRFDSESGFPKLRILNIASNFSGGLSIEFLQSLKAMEIVTNREKAKLNYIGEHYYLDSETILNKGDERVYWNVLTILTSFDLSSISFEGK
ncbi:hypothetical protein V6N12_061324 [Hibiscus sabdariffa]|uniref:Uncharacterized protein n=1 Tax=Hibiscus sabdariffa TaxID=183260 RepID=A0ABR2DWT5_9ROSI